MYFLYICISVCINIYNTCFIYVIFSALEKEPVASKAGPAAAFAPYSGAVGAMSSLCNSSESERWRAAPCRTAR